VSRQDASLTGMSIANELAVRLGYRKDPSANRLRALIEGLHALIVRDQPTEAELLSALQFFNTIGDYSDPRRQEWVLLADALGISALVRDLNSAAKKGTPSCLIGPFYRSDAPVLPLGATISLDGKGEQLAVSGTVLKENGTPVNGALVEVWHANHEGMYENQAPDLQPEFNLRGQFKTDAHGCFQFMTIRPKGYFLPEDGPVGHLFSQFGYRLQRPAHLSFRISAPGVETLTTAFFDRSDAAVGHDALFAVKPELLIEMKPASKGWETHIRINMIRQTDDMKQHNQISDILNESKWKSA
jgi:hydroxyquinol 1,2-dioxygenase